MPGGECPHFSAQFAVSCSNLEYLLVVVDKRNYDKCLQGFIFQF